MSIQTFIQWITETQHVTEASDKKTTEDHMKKLKGERSKQYDSDSDAAWETVYAKEKTKLGRFATRAAARLIGGTKLDKTGKVKK